MKIEATLPLLDALSSVPEARLVLGEWSLLGGYGTLPAVIDPGKDVPLWVGSRHVAVHAIKLGLAELATIGQHVTSYRLSREGAALYRDLAPELVLRRRALAEAAGLAEARELKDAPSVGRKPLDPNKPRKPRTPPGFAELKTCTRCLETHWLGDFAWVSRKGKYDDLCTHCRTHAKTQNRKKYA